MKVLKKELEYLYEDKKIAVAKIAGEVDLSNASDFSDFMSKVANSPSEYLIFDLQGLEYMNSTGFGSMASVAMEEKEKGVRTILFCNMGSQIRNTFSLFGLQKLWKYFDSVDEALNFIERGGQVIDEPELPTISFGEKENEPDLPTISFSEEDETELPTISFEDNNEGDRTPTDQEIKAKDKENIAEDKKKETEDNVNNTEENISEVKKEELKVSFPIVKSCTYCQKSCTFARPGHYKCPYCGTIHKVDDKGNIKQIAKAKKKKGEKNELITDIIEITLPSDAQHLSKIREFIFSFTGEMFTEEDRTNISTAVDEAAANSIEHAHNFDRKKRLKLTIETNPEKFAVTLVDEGKDTFNNVVVKKEENVDHKRIKNSGRGMGLFLIHQIMDEVQLKPTEQWGTSITMIKLLKKKKKSKKK